MYTLQERAAAMERHIKYMENQQVKTPTKTRAARLEKVKYRLSVLYCDIICDLFRTETEESNEQIENAYARAKQLGYPIMIDFRTN